MVSGQENPNAAWETESGLVDDVDGIIVNPRFGLKEEYAQAVQLTSQGQDTGLMFLVDLMDDNGEIIATQGWSVGSGWEVSEDSLSISHPKRANVVTSSMYGQLQNKCVKELGVNMGQYGSPVEAMSWNLLKFHWMQLAHKTVSGVDKTGLMPTEFFGKVELEGETAEAPAPAPAPAPTPVKVATAQKAAPGATSGAALKARLAKPAQPALSAAAQEALKLVGLSADAKSFAKAAVKVAAIANDDALMAQILDDSPSGFFAKNKK